MKSIIRSSRHRAGIFVCLLLALCAIVFGIYRTKLLDAPVAAQSASRPVTEQALAPDAATSRWRSTNGPMAGSVTALFKDGERLLAATGDSIYVSTNQGRNWKRADIETRSIGFGFSPIYITSFARAGSSLYAGSTNELLRSKDNGQTWTTVSAGIPFIQRIKTVGANIFALSRFAGIFASFDEGESWTLLTTPADSSLDFTISGTNLFVTTEKGVFRSTDLGRSWLAANNGLPSFDPQTRTISSSMVRLGSKLFVGYYSYSTFDLSQPFSSVYVSSDQGRSWTEARTGFGDAIIGNLFAAGTDVFTGTSRGVFRFNESGMNWQAVNNGLRGDFNYVFAADETSVYVGGTNDVYVSQSRGDEWTPLNVQIEPALPSAYALSGNNLFAGAPNGGVFRMNLAATPSVWERVNRGLMTANIQALAVAGNNVFCGTRDAGIYRSSDQAQNWTAANAGLTDANVTVLAVIGNMLFAGTETGGVFRSTDGGQSWTSVNQGLEEKRILTLAVKGASLFAGTDGKGMFRSDDNGANWKAVNQGLVVPGSEQVSSITSIAVSGGNLILNGSTKALDKLGQIASLFRSKDNGETWEALKPPISSGIGRSDGSTGIVLAANDTMLFAGAYSGAYVSADLGTTWREISEGLPRSGFLANGTMSISALFLTPSTVLATAGFNSLGVLGGLPNDASLNNGVYSRELATLSCQYTLDKKTLAANPAGEALTVRVTTQSSCPWTVESNVEWIAASPAETAGDGAVKLTVAPNPTVTPRTGTVTIAGETVTVAQEAGAAISPNFQAFERAGGTSAVRVTANDAVNWTAASPVSWVTFTGAAAGKGNGTINFTVAPNTAANSRRVELIIAGQKFAVSQSGADGACGIIGTIAPGQSVRGELTEADCLSEEELKNGKKSFADRYIVDATAEDGLVISVDSDDFPTTFRLISPDGSQSASHNGTIRLTGSRVLSASAPTIVEVTSSQSRATGRYLLTLSKLTGGCSYTLSPLTRRVQPDGETGIVSVTARPNCIWQAVSRTDWATITAGANGTGSGTVTYKVSTNASAEQRTARLLIAGQEVGLIQAGNPNPTLELTGISPVSTLGGGPGLMLTVNGKGFVNGSKVLWNGRERRTTFVSSTQLKAEVPAADISIGRESVSQISVLNPEPNGGRSRPQSFTILAPNQPWTPTAGPGGGTITALYRDDSQLLAGTSSSGIYRSTDRGQSWQRKFSGRREDYSLQQFAANAKYACGISQVIICSADGGETWERRYDSQSLQLYSITGLGEDFLIGTSEGIRRFRPSDNSFLEFRSPASGNQIVAIAAAGQLIFAASRQAIFSSNNARLIVSDNAGATWRSAVAGLPDDDLIQDVLIAGPNVYLATLNGVYVSSDQGRNWRTLSFTRSAYKLALAGSTLFALAYTYASP
ncbi:MAG TPA: BACON domain-containing carbohydrate-binding protein, partial [Blastocatellia bacterium]|nr:BACON domain-containing carbohydrate-binding protein [Blastocatellia bacterium]